METENKIIDLRNEHLHWTSFYKKDDEQVFEMVFENTVIILNEKQLEKLMY